MRRAITVSGMGFGDESKGQTVDYLCDHLSADLVVRYCSGCQAGHNVVMPSGRSHTFSQWGSGTLRGVETYWGPEGIIAPQYMVAEGEHLEKECGIANPFRFLNIDERCLITTPYHTAVCRARELKRWAQRHGSVGYGVGATREYDLVSKGNALRVRHLRKPLWHSHAGLLLGAIQNWASREIYKVTASRSEAESIPFYHLLCQDPQELANQFSDILEQAIIVDRCPDFQTAVFEGAQGILLDEHVGFHPHTTWATTTLSHAYQMLAENPVDEICNLGLTRTYMTRHGAGPFPTEDVELAKQLSDPNNPPNDWQQAMRFGNLDFVLLNYAKKHLGGHLDGLAISHCDQIDVPNKFCVAYDCWESLPEPKNRDLDFQQKTGEILSRAKPIYEEYDDDEDQLMEPMKALAPIVMLANGPTSDDRTCGLIPWRKW